MIRTLILILAALLLSTEAGAPDHEAYAWMGEGACMVLPSGVRFCASYGVRP
jgi:hypothetical protein